MIRVGSGNPAAESNAVVDRRPGNFGDLSTNRRAVGGWAPSELPKGQNGRNLCRRCSVEVPKGRITFCSKECVHEWRLRTDPGYLRLKTWERDQGVCAGCGTDTKALRPHPQSVRARNSGDLWQADHIIPVSEGGGECGLDNIRTLCTPCHKKATAELRRRMAERRCEAKPLLLLESTEVAA